MSYKEAGEGDQAVAPNHGPEIYYSLGTVLAGEQRGRDFLEQASELLRERTRSIRSVVGPLPSSTVRFESSPSAGHVPAVIDTHSSFSRQLS